MNKTYSIIAVSALLVLVPTAAVAFAQLQVQKQPTATPPAGFPKPAPMLASPNDPSLAYARAMVNELNHRLGNDTSLAHATQILRLMTAEGKISCATALTSFELTPGHHCFLTPPTKALPPTAR